MNQGIKLNIVLSFNKAHKFTSNITNETLYIVIYIDWICTDIVISVVRSQLNNMELVNIYYDILLL